MTRRGSLLAVAGAALLGCGPMEDGAAPEGPPPPTTGAIHAVTTVNALAQDCEVAGGYGPFLLLDGAEPTFGWVDGAWAIVHVAPGAHALSARCSACGGASLGEATADVNVVAGELAEARLDVEVPEAQGSVTVRWDTSGCGDPRAWVSTFFDGNPTCKLVQGGCSDGEATVRHLLPGAYTFEAERYDPDWTPTYGFCGCRGYAFRVVVPEGPVADGAIVVGPLSLPCGCSF